MAKRNKIRYRSTPKIRPGLMLTGNIYLLYRDDVALEAPVKGDIMVYPYNELLKTLRCGDYGNTGFSGYFKVDVFDGKNWKLVLTNNLFPNGEHRFTKAERPMDTFHICEELLKGLVGKTLKRTYREHYTLGEEEEG